MDSEGRRSLLAAALAGAVAVLLLAWVFGRLGEPAAEAQGAPVVVRTGQAYRWLADFQQRFPSRRGRSDAHAGAVAHIVAALEAAGCQDVRVERLPGPIERFDELANVHALIPGRDRSREIVLAAHHDTVDAAPGAIDDGGAVAAIVEAARVLTALPPPACDVHIAIFDGEEWGLLGAKAHVESIGDEGRDRVAAALAVELVGWHEDALVVHTIPNGFAWRSAGIAPAWVPAAVVRAGNAAAAPVAVGDPIIAPWYQGMVRVLGVQTGSDAGAYTERGVPAAMLTGSSLTNFYEAYHTQRDAMPMVSSERLDDATRVVTAAALELAVAAVPSPSRDQGARYLLVGGSHLGWISLLLIGLAAALAALAAGGYLRVRGGRFDRESGAAALAFGVALAFATLVGSVMGLVVGVPLALGLATAALWPRVAVVGLLLGFLPLVVGATATLAASLMFGFDWCGGVLEAVAQVAVGGTALAAAVLSRLAARHPKGFVRPPKDLRERRMA